MHISVHHIIFLILSFFYTGEAISAFGITVGGGYYWLSGFNGTVYAYNTDLTRASEKDFDLDNTGVYPRGITYYNDKLWVIDNNADKVYVYNTDGSRSSTDDFDLNNAANASPRGITYYNNKFYNCRCR